MRREKVRRVVAPSKVRPTAPWSVFRAAVDGMRHEQAARPPWNPAERTFSLTVPIEATHPTFPARTCAPVSVRTTVMRASSGFPALVVFGIVTRCVALSVSGGGGGGGGGGGAATQAEKQRRPHPTWL